MPFLSWAKAPGGLIRRESKGYLPTYLLLRGLGAGGSTFFMDYHNP